MSHYYLGCSGFYNSSWKDVFYPAKLPMRQWLEFYSEKFNSLEINSTFYRSPQQSTWQKWYTQTPETFRFSVKAPRTITHYKKFLNAQPALNDFYKMALDGLKEKLGPVLFQLPASFRYSDENLERILSSLDPAFVNVLEFRHIDWWSKAVFEKLESYNSIFCSISHPQLPEQLITSAKNAYIRFHGIPDLYLSSYDHSDLEKWSGEIKGAQPETCYIYFNNTITASAIDNAAKLLFLLN